MVVCYWFAVSLERPERPWRPSERRGGQRQTSTAVISGFNWSGVRQRTCNLLSRAGSLNFHKKNGVKVLIKLAVNSLALFRSGLSVNFAGGACFSVGWRWWWWWCWRWRGWRDADWMCWSSSEDAQSLAKSHRTEFDRRCRSDINK